MRRDLVLLDEIAQAAERLVELTSGLTVEEIAADDLRRDAIRPVALRNRIVHGYWSVDLEILVATAANDLSDFARRVREIRDEE